MRKTRSQTQAEAAMANTGRNATSSSNNTSSNVSSTENSNQQSVIGRGSASVQVAAINAPKRVPQPEHFKIKECEDMINLLRVVELQQILSFLNISFAGRKVDLQRRIINLLYSNYDLLSAKIREVYTQSIAEQQAQQYGPTDPKRMYSHMQMPPVPPNPAAGIPNTGQPTVVGGQPIAGVPPTGPGVANNMVPFMNPIPTHIPIHPDVRLKKLAFYDVLGVLIKPSSLVPRNTQRIQEVPFYFTLTPQQATEIASNRDIRNSNKIEHAIQVQLRFCLLETSCEQEDCFPPSVSVKVNNKLCQLPNVIPTNRPNVEPKRPPRPVNVTANVKLSPTVTNTITVQWCPDYTRGYCIAVYLVKKLTSAQLLHRMKTKGVKPADYTRGLIKEKLTEDADCEIATTMLKVSLNCPLGKMKMSIPCRASTCSHLQCFDASLYLQMNERKPTWNCPVCDKAAIYDNLVIDGYFQEVLASSLLKPDDTEIQLHKDGSWSTHSLRNESQVIDTPTKPIEKVEVISDDIEVITTEDVKMVKAGEPPVTANDQPTSTTNSETVDLTLSDSDDDMPLAKRRPAIKQSAAANATNAVSTSNINGNGGNGNSAGNGATNTNQRSAFAQQRTALQKDMVEESEQNFQCLELTDSSPSVHSVNEQRTDLYVDDTTQQLQQQQQQQHYRHHQQQQQQLHNNRRGSSVSSGGTSASSNSAAATSLSTTIIESVSVTSDADVSVISLDSPSPPHSPTSSDRGVSSTETPTTSHIVSTSNNKLMSNNSTNKYNKAKTIDYFEGISVQRLRVNKNRSWIWHKGRRIIVFELSENRYLLSHRGEKKIVQYF